MTSRCRFEAGGADLSESPSNSVLTIAAISRPAWSPEKVRGVERAGHHVHGSVNIRVSADFAAFDAFMQDVSEAVTVGIDELLSESSNQLGILQLFSP